MSKIKLEIFNADTTLYWREHFNSQAEADVWLETERSRPYWKSDFTWQFTVKVDPEPDLEEIAKEESRKNKKRDAAQALKSFDKTKMKAADVADILEQLMILQGLK